MFFAYDINILLCIFMNAWIVWVLFSFSFPEYLVEKLLYESSHIIESKLNTDDLKL